jgi:hypothetical protein
MSSTKYLRTVNILKLPAAGIRWWELFWWLNIATLCVIRTENKQHFYYGLCFIFCFSTLKTDDQVQYNQQSEAHQPNKSPSRWVL